MWQGTVGSTGVFDQLVSSCPMRHSPFWNGIPVFCKIFKQMLEMHIFMDNLQIKDCPTPKSLWSSRVVPGRARRDNILSSGC